MLTFFGEGHWSAIVPIPVGPGPCRCRDHKQQLQHRHGRSHDPLGAASSCLFTFDKQWFLYTLWEGNKVWRVKLLQGYHKFLNYITSQQDMKGGLFDQSTCDGVSFTVSRKNTDWAMIHAVTGERDPLVMLASHNIALHLYTVVVKRSWCKAEVSSSFNESHYYV